MTERGKEVAKDEARTLEMLCANQDVINHRLDDLTTSVHRLMEEFRREFNLLGARQPRQQRHRRVGAEHPNRLHHSLSSDLSDFGEDSVTMREPNRRESSDEEGFNRCRPHRPRYRPQNRHPLQAVEFKVKLDIPFFDGHLQLEDFLDWENSVENFFDYMEIDPQKQVKYVACRLKGGASAWWEQTLQLRRREGKGPIRSWRRMKQLMRTQFLPTDFEQILFMRYQHCAQGLRSVSEYTEEFNRLRARNNLNETPNQLVARYIVGLKDSIQDKLELNSVWSIAQAVNLAMKIEIQQSRQSKTSSNRRLWSESSSNVTKSGFHTPAKGASSAIPIDNTTSSSPGAKTVQENKIQPKVRPPFKENPYQPRELPAGYNTSPTFNVSDIWAYKPPDEAVITICSLESSSSEAGED